MLNLMTNLLEYNLLKAMVEEKVVHLEETEEDVEGTLGIIAEAEEEIETEEEEDLKKKLKRAV